MDDAWKKEIDFAFQITCVAALPIRSYDDRRNMFRFVRAELLEKQTGDEEDEDYIHSVFDSECGHDDDSSTEQNSE